MNKKVLSILTIIISAIALISCTLAEVVSISFMNEPKQIYKLNDEMEKIFLEVVYSDSPNPISLNSDDKRVKITGFDTSTIGTKKLIVSYEGVTIEATYRVVANDIDGYFAGGTGIEGDPYLISTPQQLDNIRLATSSCFKLINDIDLNNFEWIPIGNIVYGKPDELGRCPILDVEAFSGQLDGNGHKILNFNTLAPGFIELQNKIYQENNSSTRQIALFVAIIGTEKKISSVKNIEINIDFKKYSYYNFVGALSVCSNLAEFSNILFTGDVLLGSKYANEKDQGSNTKDNAVCFGSIMSWGSNVKIYNCVNRVNIDGKWSGGFIGQLVNDDNITLIQNSLNLSSNINGVISDDYNLGGGGAFVGRTNAGSNLIIDNSHTVHISSSKYVINKLDMSRLIGNIHTSGNKLGLYPTNGKDSQITSSVAITNCGFFDDENLDQSINLFNLFMYCHKIETNNTMIYYNSYDNYVKHDGITGIIAANQEASKYYIFNK